MPGPAGALSLAELPRYLSTWRTRLTHQRPSYWGRRSADAAVVRHVTFVTDGPARML